MLDPDRLQAGRNARTGLPPDPPRPPGAAWAALLHALREHGSDVRVAGRGQRARAQCPSHGSHGGTLSLTAQPGRVLVNCHAGCDTIDVLTALGLQLRDLYDDLPSPAPPAGPARPPKPAPAHPLIPDVGHLLDRMMAEQALEDDPAYRARRAQELADARQARPTDHPGGPVEWDTRTTAASRAAMPPPSRGVRFHVAPLGPLPWTQADLDYMAERKRRAAEEWRQS